MKTKFIAVECANEKSICSVNKDAILYVYENPDYDPEAEKETWTEKTMSRTVIKLTNGEELFVLDEFYDLLKRMHYPFYANNTGRMRLDIIKIYSNENALILYENGRLKMTDMEGGFFLNAD